MLPPSMPAPTAALEDDFRRLLDASAPDVIAWGVARFGRKLAVASSFSIEDCVVIDLASKAARAAKADGIRVFALDTGRLPDETYHDRGARAHEVRRRDRMAVPATRARSRS